MQDMQDELESPRGTASLHLILTIFLGVGMVLFGVLATYAWTDNSNIHSTLDQRLAKAKTEAAAKQKDEDTLANQKANELPYYSFVANAQDGAFTLQLPKNWSIYNGRSAAGSVQLNMLSDPETVVDNLGGNAQNTHALVVQLLRQSQTEVLQKYSEKVKLKKLTQSSVEVSGMAAVKLEGAIDEQRHTGILIVLPVRDKTLTFTVQDMKYAEQFNKIVSTAKINP
jgi:hypothetical protein